jgi:hypothetical protein
MMHKIYKINGKPAGFADLNVFHRLAQQFLPYAHKKLGFNKPVSVNLLSDPKNKKDPLGKTAYYDPNKMEITLFVDKRHVKDILRSMAHELVHHTQNCRGEFKSGANTGPGYAQEDGHMRKMEAEAYLEGSGFLFRDWEDSLKKEKKIMKEVKGHKGPCDDVHEDLTHEEWEKKQDKVNEVEEELEERTKRDTPDRVSGRDTSGRRLKPLEEQEEEETVEEGYSPEQRKKLADLEKKYPNRDTDSKQAAEYTKAHKKIIPARKSKPEKKDEMYENWTRGNKDELLFERLKEKWCK